MMKINMYQVMSNVTNTGGYMSSVCFNDIRGAQEWAVANCDWGTTYAIVTPDHKEVAWGVIPPNPDPEN